MHHCRHKSVAAAILGFPTMPQGITATATEANHQEIDPRAFLTHFAPNRVATTTAPTAAAAKKAAWIPV
jgi:hypothetical protein